MTQQVQTNARPTLDWDEKNGTMTTTLQYAGFQVYVKAQMDVDYNWDMRGTFTDTLSETTIPNPRHTEGDHSTYCYFEPLIPLQDRIEALMEQGNSKDKATRLAKQQVQEDALICADPDAAGYTAMMVTATASLLFDPDIELGHDCIGGVEVYLREFDYLNEVAWDAIEEAVREAKEKTDNLRQFFA